AGGRSERSEISPLVARVEWLPVVRRVGGVDLDRAVAGHEGSERLVDERRIRQLRARSSRIGEQLLVDCGTDSHTCHATLIPHTCHKRAAVRPVSYYCDRTRWRETFGPPRYRRFASARRLGCAGAELAP